MRECLESTVMNENNTDEFKKSFLGKLLLSSWELQFPVFKELFFAAHSSFLYL